MNKTTPKSSRLAVWRIDMLRLPAPRRGFITVTVARSRLSETVREEQPTSLAARELASSRNTGVHSWRPTPG